MYSVIILALCIFIVFIIIIIFYKKNKKVSEGFSTIENSGLRTFANLTNNSDNPWTIDKPTKLIITDIIRKIINNINTQTNMSYYFVDYDQLKQDVISPMETRFTADIFVHEMKNLFSRRILLIFAVNFATKEVQVQHVNLSNAFKNPEKAFMDYPAPALLLQDDNLLHNEYQIMGRNNSKLDFSILKDSISNQLSNGNHKDVPTPIEFQKWILPMGINSAYQNPQAIFPSRRQSTCWDNNGVNYIESQTSLQMGVKNSPLTRYPYPYFNPTTNMQKTIYDTEYKWMFDFADNHSGFGRNVASSP
jgi:hypothetical protein